jgi:hypothetical protein
MNSGDVFLSKDVLPVDRRRCGPQPKLTFVRFLGNFHIFGFIKYALGVLPSAKPYILYLRYYRPGSDGVAERSAEDADQIPRDSFGIH